MDTYQQTTSYGSRVGNSFVGALIGFVLFIGSFALLYWNEGRIDLSTVAIKATDITQIAPADASAYQGKLISFSGPITTDAKVNDNLFLKPDTYVLARRDAEMFAYRENKSSHNSVNSYTYPTEWTSSPEDSSHFYVPQGHENPSMPYQSTTVYSDKTMIGGYVIDAHTIHFPDGDALSLDPSDVTISGKQKISADKKYIFVSADGKTTVDAPAVGDIRVSYSVIKSGTFGTVFGTLDGTSIAPFQVSETLKNNDTLYHFLFGSRTEAIASLHTSYSQTLWLFRGIGFGMMFIGMLLILGPVSALLSFIPFLSSLSGFLFAFFAFIASLVLSVAVIVVAMIAHSVTALIVTAVVVIVAVLFGGHALLGRHSSPPAPTA